MLFALLLSPWLWVAPFFTPESAPAFSKEVSAPPVVTWLTEQDYDFGEIHLGGTRKFIFKYKNATAEPLLLQTVRTSCGCTAAEWTEAPLAPGETGEITIEFDANIKGAFRKKIRVFFDRQRKPEILWVEGEVI